MYAIENFKTKKALKQAVKDSLAALDASVNGAGIPCYQPGPFGPGVKDGEHCCEGPHYPEPHKWHATVTVKDGRIVKVK